MFKCCFYSNAPIKIIYDMSYVFYIPILYIISEFSREILEQRVKSQIDFERKRTTLFGHSPIAGFLDSCEIRVLKKKNNDTQIYT